MRQKVLWSGVLLLFFVKMTMAQITGKVEDEYGPLRGAMVSIVGTKTAVETDENGAFSIKGKLGDVLKVTDPVLFSEKEFIIKAFNMGVLKLKEKAVNLEVVVAFGKQKKENLTGSVAVVDSKAFEDRPISNAVQALQGQVAGMNFNLGSSGTELGESPAFNVRGLGSLSTDSSPLVLIDGLEGDLSAVNPQDIESISVLKDAASSSVYGSRAAFGVVLVTTKSGKDGKATINYNNNFRWSAPTLVPKMLDSETFIYYYNDAYANLGQEPRFNSNQLTNAIKYKYGEIKDETMWYSASGSGEQWFTTGGWGNTDWYREFYKQSSPSQEHNLTVSGGNSKVNYYMSANYLGEEGLLRYNTDTNERYALSGKFSAWVNSWMKVQYNTRFTRQNIGKPSYIDGARGDFYESIIKMWPIYPLKDPNGHYVEGNKVNYLNMGRYRRERDLLSQQLNFTFEPIKKWRIYANFSYRTDTRFDDRYYLPIYMYDDKGEPSYETPRFRDRRYGQFSEGGISLLEELAYKSNYFSPNIYTDYNFNLGKHSFKPMIGFQTENFKYRDIVAKRDGLISPEVISLSTTDGKNYYVNGGIADWATMGAFGRLNYDYEGRYLLEFNLRYDGSSRYLRDQRWNWYPSASLGWNIAREGFWGKLGAFGESVKTFKFRASYGDLGNQQTRGYYPFFQTMPLDPGRGFWLIDGQVTNVAYAPGLISESLTWEKVATTNVGLDIVAFRNRLNLTLDFFNRKTKGMVGPAPELPGTLGTRVPLINNTDMVSNGFELALGWNDKVGKDFRYSVNATLTDSRQKITKYHNVTGAIGLDPRGAPYYRTGMYLGEIWGLTTHGIAKTDEEMQEWLKTHDQSDLDGGRGTWAAGDIMFEDLDGDGRVTRGNLTLGNHGDMRIIGNSTPRYNFGLDVNMSYKGFDFRMFFQGVGKRDLALDSETFAVPNSMFSGANTSRRSDGLSNVWPAAAFVQHLDYFRGADTNSRFGPNLDAYYPRPLFEDGYKNFILPQTKYLQDGSYVRLKNVQLGYTLPKKLVSKMGVSKFRVYFSAENVYTWTKLIGIFDPEVVDGVRGRGKMYPLSRVLATGINITF